MREIVLASLGRGRQRMECARGQVLCSTSAQSSLPPNWKIGECHFERREASARGDSDNYCMMRQSVFLSKAEDVRRGKSFFFSCLSCSSFLSSRSGRVTVISRGILSWPPPLTVSSIPGNHGREPIALLPASLLYTGLRDPCGPPRPSPLRLAATSFHLLSPNPRAK